MEREERLHELARVPINTIDHQTDGWRAIAALASKTFDKPASWVHRLGARQAVHACDLDVCAIAAIAASTWRARSPPRLQTTDEERP